MAYCANRNLNPTTGSGTTRTVAHATPAFLPWHRVFSRMLERSLQVAIGDNELGLPYWDWVQGWSGMEQYFGGDGDPNNQNLLKDGPFVLSKWQLPEIYPFPLKGVMRKLGDDSGYSFPAQQEIDQMLQLRAYDLPPFSDVGNTNSFRNMIEGWGNGNHHNGIHRW
jgi:tyrosinase